MQGNAQPTYKLRLQESSTPCCFAFAATSCHALLQLPSAIANGIKRAEPVKLASTRPHAVTHKDWLSCFSSEMRCLDVGLLADGLAHCAVHLACCPDGLLGGNLDLRKILSNGAACTAGHKLREWMDLPKSRKNIQVALLMKEFVTRTSHKAIGKTMQTGWQDVRDFDWPCLGRLRQRGLRNKLRRHPSAPQHGQSPHKSDMKQMCSTAPNCSYLLASNSLACYVLS